jgi:CMP-N-acetylneuraminic acid synthetase
MKLCFIPARGGSRRIPRKNVLPFGGKPLVAWTISSALCSRLFDRVVVSTDDNEILSASRDAGAQTDRRPEHLAGDRIRFVEVLEEFLTRPENLGLFKEVMVLLPTCPLRSEEDIHAVQSLRLRQPESFVVSISRYEFPPEFACDFDQDSAELVTRQPGIYARSTQSQSVNPAYHPNGAIFAGPVERFLETKSFFISPVLGSLMPPERSLDLDFPHQWELAEKLIQK